MRTLMRRASLTIPAVRKFFDDASRLRDEVTRLQAEQRYLNDVIVQQRDYAETSVASQKAYLEAEIAGLRRQLAEVTQSAAEERASSELQMYVLRSDQQRAAARNEAIAAKYSEEARVRRLEITSTDAVRSDLELLYAKIAGRLTMLSSDILRLAPTSGGNPTLYLDLLERALTGVLVADPAMDPWTKGHDPEIRAIGRDWPSTAATMIGIARLRNLRVLAEQVLTDGVPGDFLEAGVWRGGACILIRGVLLAHDITDRKVWVADSFSGLPAPDPAYPADAGDRHAEFRELAVSSAEVRANFERYGLLDERVCFLEGWFSDTLPSAPIEKLALLRLDGDMYSSTIQTLDALYKKVSPGGFIVVDDYVLKGCRQAIHDFRDREGITEAMQDVDGAAIYWRKAR